jgi:hypothetical protein
MDLSTKNLAEAISVSWRTAQAATTCELHCHRWSAVLAELEGMRLLINHCGGAKGRNSPAYIESVWLWNIALEHLAHGFKP